MPPSASGKCALWIASSFLAITGALHWAHVAGAQTTALGCSHLSILLDQRAALGSSLQDPALKKVDPAQAEAACRDALRVDPVNPDRMFQLARALTLANKHIEAIKYYLDAADRGHAGAMNDLGGVFEHGIGVPVNLSTAVEWYQRAAGAGDTGAMAHLGELSEEGSAIPQDLAKARHWYEQAATLGDAGSMSSLARLLKQAGELSAALEWYRKAAAHGVPSAMNSLGELSEAGMGVAQDYGTARTWYRKAAELGHADAMGHLGALLDSGRGGPQDIAGAQEWNKKGAALNGPVAMHNLAAMTEHGRGTAKSLTEAILWYERAAALGYPPALTALGRLHLNGTGVARNYARAKSLFERASELGDAGAMNNLGLLYLDGRGVLRDIKLARTWFERAAILNDAQAKQNLDRLDRAGLTDGAQIAARRASCVQTCAGLQRSYVSSACERHASTSSTTEEKPERAKCIEMSLTLARQCRDSCREWASTLSPENACLACFQSAIACSAGRESFSQETPYAPDSNGCLGSLAECTASCSRETISSGIAD